MEKKEIKTASTLTYVGGCRTYTECGVTYKEVPKVSVSDECKNGVCELHVLVDVNRKGGNGHWYDHGWHHDIDRFPKLQMFQKLDNCNMHGYHTHVYANALFHLTQGDCKAAQSLLRATDVEMNIIRHCCDEEDVRYWVWKLGIEARWQKEMDDALAYLEELCGCKWVNPYDNEKFVTPVTPLDVATWCEQEQNGWFNTNTMILRKQMKTMEKKMKLMEERLMHMCKVFEKEIDESKIKLELIKFELEDNAIYYDHKNTLVFNWKDYGKQVTVEQFMYFVEHCDKKMLPEGLNVELKQNGKSEGIAIAKNGKVAMIKSPDGNTLRVEDIAKLDLIRQLSKIVAIKANVKGFCYGLIGEVRYAKKEWHIDYAAFSELPEDNGKLFFRLIHNNSRTEKEVLAEQLDVESLEDIIKKNNIN